MVILKSLEEVVIMRQGGEILKAILAKLREAVKPGIKTISLDAMVVAELNRRGAEASFKGYQGFPASLCVSVNDEIVHGIPGDRELKEGDIVSLDVGVKWKGFHTDAAITVGVGKISPDAERLIAITEQSLEEGVAHARHGVYLKDVSAAVQRCAEGNGFSVVREYSGHGVGRELHEDPQIPNFVCGRGILLRQGMTLAIEPMINIGDWRTRLAANRWTVLTVDGSLSAHFEHTIAITDNEAEVLA